MARRAAWILLLCALSLASLLPVGCGTSEGTVIATGDPPGRQIPGTGAVDTPEEALERLLSEYLGLPATRQDGGPVIGQAGAPLAIAYRLHAGATPAGTVIRPFFADEAYRLNDHYFVYFVDLAPIQEYEHAAFIVYLRRGDGRFFEQSVASFPVVDDQLRLIDDDDRRDNVVYTHFIFEEELPNGAGRQDGGLPMSGADSGGLFLGGSSEGRRQHDLDNTAEFMQNLTGEANPLSVLWHNHPDPIDKDDFEEALAKASEGLGPGDKFWLFVSTHGGAPPTSRFQVGTERMTYDELCRALAENVTAGSINIVMGACFSGQMDEVFKGWEDDTAKAVHWITAAPDDKPAYANAVNGGWVFKCTMMKMQEALEAARADGQVTLFEIEQAFADLELTGDEILQKICDYYIEKYGADNDEVNEYKRDLENDDGPGDKHPRPGNPKKGGFGRNEPVGPNVFIPEDGRRLPLPPLGGGGGFVGGGNVDASDGAGFIDSLELGIRFTPSFFDLRLKFRPSDQPSSLPFDVELGGPIIQLGGSEGNDIILVDPGPGVISLPDAGDDDLVWSVWNSQNANLELLFPPRPKRELDPTTQLPTSIRLMDGPLRPILPINPLREIPAEQFNDLRTLLALVNGTITPPNGDPVNIEGLAALFIRPLGEHRLDTIITFPGFGQEQNAFFLQSTLPAPTPDATADFDGDGDVDAADYVLMQRNFGATGDDLVGDTDNSGSVDETDFNAWRDQFTGPGLSDTQAFGSR